MVSVLGPIPLCWWTAGKAVHFVVSWRYISISTNSCSCYCFCSCSCSCFCYFISSIFFLWQWANSYSTLWLKFLFFSLFCSYAAPCVDKHPNKCPLWAKYGECKKNKTFMEENCWKSCSKCTYCLYTSFIPYLFVCLCICFSCSFFVANRYSTFLYLIFLTGCKDKKKHCESWAKDGECTKNPDFMNENCAKSCNKC